MANNNSIAINSNSDFYKIVADANATIDSMFDTIREMDETNDDTSKKLEEMINKVKSFKDSLDKKTKAKNERPISLKESKSTDMIPTTAVVKDDAPTVDKGCNDSYEDDSLDDEDSAIEAYLESLTWHKLTPNDDDNERYNKLIEGAKEWKTPKFSKDDLRRSFRATFESLPEAEQEKYVLYNLCFNDALHREKSKSVYCNIISIIAYNALHVLNVSNMAELRKYTKLPTQSELVNSGLFLYRSADERRNSATVTPDCYLKVWIPKDVERQLIIPSNYHVTCQVASCYPLLTGVIMNFNDMKKLLLNDKVIVSLSFANDMGMHCLHSRTLRDTKTNNYWIQDTSMTHDIISQRYDI